MAIPETRITPPTTFSFNLSEIRDNGELLFFFVWRDIKVKYRQAFLGILWAVLQPLLMMAALYFIFFQTFHNSTQLAYPIHAFGAVIFWGLFSSGIMQSSESLLNSGAMIRRIYFPRLIIPLSALLAALVDFLIAFIVFIIFTAFYRPPLSWNALWCVPATIVFTVLASLGFGLLLSALNVKYRDFRYILPFAMQFLFIASQIAYSIDSISIPEWLGYVLYLNPLNGVIELFKLCFGAGANWTGIGISIAETIIFFFIGLYYFKKTESTFADTI